MLQDSDQIYSQNAPIKNSDTSMIGLTRATEVGRRLDFEMQKRQQQVLEVTFKTGLEGIAVEPGDHCIVGVLTTDFELGWGGRVMEGSTNYLVGDREVSLTSGTIYDLHRSQFALCGLADRQKNYQLVWGPLSRRRTLSRPFRRTHGVQQQLVMSFLSCDELSHRSVLEG